MSFLAPEYLLFMFVPILVLFYLIVTGKSLVASVFDERMVEKLTFDNDTLGRTGRNIMLFVALSFMIVALARPVLPREEITLKTPTLDLVIALDISRSMLATDLYPDRLALAKRRIAETIEALKGARIALLAFSDAGFVVAPMTDDTATLRFLLENLSVESVSTQGTRFLIPIQKAGEMLRKSAPRHLLLFTDGGDRSDFSKEIEAAKKAGLKVDIYALGTKKGAPIPYHGDLLKDKKGDIVIVGRNDTIAALAKESGGGYYRWDGSGTSLKRLIKRLRNEQAAIREVTIKTYRELFYYPLAAALLFMLFAFSSLPKMKKHALALLLVPLLSLAPSAKASLFDFAHIREARKAYESGAYDKALKLYEKVARSKQNAAAYYAVGNAYYKNGRYEKALTAYGHVVTDDLELEYKKEFNMGNCYFRLGRYEKALELYLKAQKIHDSEDLRYNIELTKKKLKKRRKKSASGSKKSAKSQQKQNTPKSSSGTQKEPSETRRHSSSQKLSEEEMRAWERRLEKKLPKTKPLKFKTPSSKRVRNEKPW